VNATDRFKILLNIIAKVGIEGDVIGELSRTMAGLNGMESMTAMQAQQPMPPQMPNEAVSAPMSGQETVTPNPMTEGQGTLNLPQ
jgi:hypothetical protein